MSTRKMIIDKMIANRRKIAAVSIAALLLLLACFMNTYGASSVTATGKVDATAGAYLRSKATTSSSKVKLLKNNTKLTIYREVFTSKKSTKTATRWYYVAASGKKGYVRADLVDTIKYSAIKKKTTDALNYRVGPDTAMTRKGTFSKNTTLSVVLPASVGESGKTWYKVKKGSSYYFVDSRYTKDSTSSTAASTSAATKPAASATTTTVMTPASSSAATPPIKEGVRITGITYPVSLGQYCSFTLKGVIESADKIDKVRVGVVDSSGKWVIDESVTPDGYTYDIKNIDAKIKFGTLAVGTYTYRINVVSGGKTTALAKYEFKVKKVKWPKEIGDKAVALCWPVGTSSATYSYPDGKQSPAYKAAMDTVFPGHNSWGKVTRVGASCDVFVSTVVRAVGYDTSFPTALQKQRTHLASSSKWNLVNYHFKESELQHGDVIVYKRSNGEGHILVYVKIDGKGYLAEAAYKSKFAMLNKSLKKILTPASNVVEFKVYRAAS